MQTSSYNVILLILSIFIIIIIIVVQFCPGHAHPRVQLSSSMDGDCLWRRLARPGRVGTPRAMRLKRKKKGGFSCESSEWSGLGVPDLVATALLEAGITKPTEIQSRAITTALSRRCDIIGASETVCVINVDIISL